MESSTLAATAAAPDPRTLAGLLARNAQWPADASALSGTGGAELSHAALQAQVARMVAQLNKLGVGRGDCVAIVLPQGLDLAVAFLGVAAGASAAPLNPAYGQKDFSFYLADLNARALLLPPESHSPARAAALALGVPIIELVATERGAGQFDLSGSPGTLTAPAGFAAAEDVALILHTSGTTARPKQVPLTQANLLASARHISDTLQLQATDRCLNVMPLFHIHGLAAGVLAALWAGSRTVCAPPFAAEPFFDWLKHWQPTWYSAVPTMHQAILAHAEIRPELAMGSSLRLIRSSSAALPPTVMLGLEAAFNVPVIEAYGMTEAAHQMASNPLPPRARKPGSVGLAAGPEVVVLDASGTLLAPGETGEVAICGANVTTGYSQNPTANSAAFSGRWFRTGDQGYLDHEGYLFLTSRLKELINRGGEKIAPREIDEVLLAHPSVRQAVTFAVPHATLGEDLAAAVVLKTGVNISESELRDFALERLPLFKVPSRMVFLAEIPKGPTGKLQRIGLAEKLADALVITYAAPADATETLVAETMQQVLGGEPLGRHDNFFFRGGDSLRATQVATRLEAALGWPLTGALIFRYPTPALLAPHLSQTTSANSRPLPRAVPTRVERQPELAIYPAAAGQRQMWFLHHYEPNSAMYNVPSAFQLAGDLQVACLAAAFVAVIQRHAILRTTFRLEADELWQCVAATSAFQLEQRDCENLPGTVESFLRAEASRPLNLARGQSWRAVLVRLSPRENILLVVMHHAISDGWSRANFYRDLGTAYAAAAQGQAADWPELPIQFTDYSAWQTDRWQRGELTPQLHYWQQQLANPAEPLALPTDHPRPPQPSFSGDHITINLPETLVNSLKARAQEEGATLFMLLLAAFKVLLHRYTGQTDLAVGVPIAGRSRVETEPLIGYFVNTLVMRTQLAEDLTFREWLRRVKTTAVAAYAHPDVPIERLAETLVRRRETERAPLFQVALALKDFPAAELALAGIIATPQTIATPTAKFDLHLNVEPKAGDWLATLEYRTELFSAERMAHLLGHWTAILESVAKNPEQLLTAIPLLSAAEREKILVTWNQTARPYALAKTLPQWIEEQVARTPMAVAVGFEEQTLTYHELNERANQLAQHLRGLGVGPDILVAICVERSLEMMIGLLGILKAGGAYVPIDPHYPADRVAFMLADAQAPVLLTQTALQNKLPATSAQVIFLDDPTPPFRHESAGNPAPLAQAEHLAYVIYTSGSTGRPKGVMISHRAICNRLLWMQEAYPMTPADRVLQKTPISFDISVWELFWPLMQGGRLVIARPEGHRDSHYLVELINRQAITIVHFVPSMLRSFLAEPAVPSCQTLRLVFCSGEALPEDLQETFFQRLPGLSLNNLYGPTEAAVEVSRWICLPNSGLNCVPIGRPIANLQLYILDAADQPVAVGVAGELHIGGVGLARGYLNRPDLTAEKFIAHPFSSQPGDRLYRTGDLTRFLPDGTIEFLGRMDQQVKIRGHRIELGEIETALSQHAAIAHSAVLAQPDAINGAALNAFIVLRPVPPPTLEALRSWLAVQLPDYMLPARFVVVPALPLTPNGKLDRKALAQLTGAALTTDTTFIAPRDERERVLVEIWQTVLRQPRVGVRDDFFELGGHSLLAIVIGSQITQRLGATVPLAWLFDHPTIEQLAAKLAGTPAPPKFLAPPPIPHSPPKTAPPVATAPPSLTEWFEAQANQTPSAVAVELAQQSLTYRELQQRSTQLARHLQTLGAAPEMMIGLCVERSLEMVVAGLAILKTGAALVPLEPDLPPERIEFILADSQLRWLLTHSASPAQPTARGTEILHLDQLLAALPTDNSTAVFRSVAQPENLAYTLYTSGSTGQPKGVMITHGAYLKFAQAAIAYWGYRPGDRVLQFARLSFDVGLDQLLTPLLAGATVVLRAAEMWPPSDFSQVVQTLRLTVAHLPAAYWKKWVETFRPLDGERVVGGLRLLMVGGEVMPVAAVRQWRAQRLPGVRLVNRYGPTETTMFCTAYEVSAEAPAGESPARIPIGRPVGPRTLHILDAEKNPVPVGVTGEIYLGGETLARGYWQRPELTTERFVPDTISGQPGARLYRTGDLACWLPDGNVDFIGRADFQIKLRGYRIELGEIEAVLSQQPEVAMGVVTTQIDSANEPQLVAFLVLHSAPPPALETLRAQLAKQLPDYMIPVRWVVVPALPMSSNGKLDRRALATLTGQELTASTALIAPRNETERALTEIWQTILHRAPIGVVDDFFALGGHSLLALNVCAHIARNLEVEVPLRWIFEQPTIAQLAGKITAHSRRKNLPLHARPRDQRTPVVPMSFAQQGLWLLEQTNPDAATYNQPYTWHFTGAVEPLRVQRALRAIMARHEILRTALSEQNGELVQQIFPADAVAWPWQEVDLRAVPLAEKMAAATACLRAEANQVFNLAQAPLWRALWVHLSAQEQVLQLSFHHTIIDEWSKRMLNEELEPLYASNGDVAAAGLADLPIQYADYAVWQRQQLTGEHWANLQSFWRQQLLPLPPTLTLPTRQARPPRPSGHGAVHSFPIGEPLTTQLRDLARSEKTTIYTVMLTAYYVWLQRYSGQNDLIIGTPMTTRRRPEVKNLIGFFLNTLPLRVNLENTLTFRAAIRRVRKLLLAAFSHAELPFEQIVGLTLRDRSAGQTPLLQVMFVLLEEGFIPPRFGSAHCERWPQFTDTSKCDLQFSVEAQGAHWEGQLTYATDLFSAENVVGMARQLTTLLTGITQNPETALGELPLLEPAEREQILKGWSQREPAASPAQNGLAQLAEVFARQPDAVALVLENHALTYGELNARANRLAEHLRARGVGPNTVVAVGLERSLEMFVSVLAILKAGGAYAPLDPAYPRERLRLMLRDLNCRVIITQATLRPLLAEGAWEFLLLDTFDWHATSAPEVWAEKGAPTDLAYVLYTSGSTGQPKGVAMPHQALSNLLQWQRTLSAAALGTRTLQFAQLGFDVSFQEIFSTWLTGGTLVVANEATRRDPLALLQLLAAEKIERLFLPFIVLEQLALAAEHFPQLPSQLREISVAGEQLRVSPTLRRFFERQPHCRFWNHYGPTETHVVTSHELVGQPAAWPELPPIGRPVPGCEIYLLDAALNPVPPAVTGELYIGGVCLAHGYHQQPELTAEKFIPNPFSSVPGARLYRTGDLARWLPDGLIAYHGRTDEQVKVRGYRIELGEIEVVLGQHPDVAACAVTVQTGEAGDSRLVALVVPRAPAAPTADLLRTWLATQMPDYQIPARFRLAPALPLNANGKLDRPALARLVGKEMASGTEYAAPRNALERGLAEIWQTVLRSGRVGIHDNFFHLGGHSLLVMTLSLQLKKQLGMEVPLRWIFDTPTVAGLAEKLAQIKPAKTHQPPPPISAVNRARFKQP